MEPRLVRGQMYRSKHTGAVFLACDCGWARTAPEERREYLVLFGVTGGVAGLRYNPDTLSLRDWEEVQPLDIFLDEYERTEADTIRVLEEWSASRGRANKARLEDE